MTISAGVSLRRRLEELYRFERIAMRPGLAGVERLLERADRPDRAFPSILIAGTNGKGSTAAHVASILRAAGLRTGLYTSPHLIRFEERIRVDGAEIGSAELEALLSTWWPRFEEEKPSFFEAATALCFDHFRAARVDVAVVEVGLGGRLDATNVLVPRVSVITTISSDHTEILGHTLRRIAIEKAGIVKEGGRLALGVAPGEGRRAILEVASERGASVSLLGEDADVRVLGMGIEGTEFRLRSRSYDGTLQTPLVGRHQARNAALAALATELYLEGRPTAEIASAIANGISATRWPARAEVLQGNPPVLVDAAHNVEGAAALAETVAALWPGKPVVFVAGFSRDKAHEAILRTLGRAASRFILTRYHGERAMMPDELLRVAPTGHLDCEAVDDPMEALATAKAWALRSNGALVLTGSLYLIGEALPLLGAEVPRAL
jgi:dihydrofolate synthase/folylpolyglutamate synthase